MDMSKRSNEAPMIFNVVSWNGVLMPEVLMKLRLNFPPMNRPYSYSQYWTGTSLQWRLMRGNCKLVPVQYWEYEYGLLREISFYLGNLR